MEYLPIIFIVLIAILVLIVIQINKPTGSAQSIEQFTYEMPLETVKAALDRILTEPINVLKIDRFWGPSEIVASGDGHYTLRYSIYFETPCLPDNSPRPDQVSLNRITLQVDVREKDKNTSIVCFAFKDNVGLIKGSSCDFITSVTKSRLTQNLAQLSLQRKGY